MPRGQDAPVKSGGQIDPYIASSMQQNRQLSENRLLNATREAGATSRANAANQTAISQQQMQMQGQQKMQAAELEAQDRRAAEAERGRREDQEWRTTQSEISQQLARELETNRLDWEKSKYQNDTNRMDELDKRADDMELIQLAIMNADADVSQNVTLKSIKAVGRAMESEEKTKTFYMEQGERDNRLKNIYKTSKENIKDRLASDSRIAFTPGMQTSPASNFSASYQEALAAEGGKITLEDLKSPGLTKLKTKAMAGELQPEDFRVMWAVTDGMAECLQDKIDEASTKVEEDYYKHAKSEILNYKRAVKRESTSEINIQTGTNRTFGRLIQDGLGNLEGFSPGSTYNQFKEQGFSWEDFYKEMTSAKEPYSIPDVPLSTTSAKNQLKKIREIYETKRTGVGD